MKHFPQCVSVWMISSKMSWHWNCVYTAVSSYHFVSGYTKLLLYYSKLLLSLYQIFSTSFTPVKQQTFWKRILSLLQSSLQWSVRKNTDNRNIMVTHTQTINGWKAKFYNHAIPAVFKKRIKIRLWQYRVISHQLKYWYNLFNTFYLFENCFM